MLIHSNTLSEFDIRAAVPMDCYLAGHYNRNRDWASIHCVGSRSHNRAYSVRLSGSSRYSMANLPDKSATWDEWGIFIDALFTLDPSAKIGFYGDREDFIAKTTDEYNRCRMYRSDLGRKAPWLAHN